MTFSGKKKQNLEWIPDPHNPSKYLTTGKDSPPEFVVTDQFELCSSISYTHHEHVGLRIGHQHKVFSFLFLLSAVLESGLSSKSIKHVVPFPNGDTQAAAGPHWSLLEPKRPVVVVTHWTVSSRHVPPRRVTSYTAGARGGLSRASTHRYLPRRA